MLKNQKILFIVEKPSQADRIKDLEIFKNMSINNEINFHYAHCTVSYYAYKYPNNLKYKDLPFIGDLSYKLDVSKEDEFYKKYHNQKTSPYCLARNNLNKEFFLNYDIVILATDYDRSGFYGAYLELEQVLGENFETLFKDMHVINTNHMTEVWLTDELNSCFTNEEFKKERINEFYKMVNQCKIKKYFEYNFQMNSNIFVKEVYKNLFLQDFKDNKEFEENYTNYGFTKYMLLAMISYFKHLENNKDYFFEGELYYYLNYYIGTGKYKNKYFMGLGSPCSRGQIIKNLINLRIINRSNTNDINDKSIFKFDEKVGNMIMLLNKKLYDPDLPFRIEEWQLLEFEEAKEKIKRYLKDVFIKQKIKNSFLKK